MKNRQSKQQEEEKLDLELDSSTAQGTYANLCIVNHSTSEFVIDFISFMPGVPKAKVSSRIILPPENAKRLLSSLSENIKNFEEEAAEMTNEDEDMTMNFGPLGRA